MMGFFILPIVVFLGWSTYKLFKFTTNKPEKATLSEYILRLKKAKRPAQKWQHSYNLAQEVQKLRQKGQWDKIAVSEKNTFFDSLEEILFTDSSKANFSKYFLILLGQLKEKKAYDILLKGLKSKDEENHFYSAWGLAKHIMQKQEPLSEKEKIFLRSWLESEDSNLQKISISVLAQKKIPNEMQKLLEKQLLSKDNSVRWNTAVALTSTKNKSAYPVLLASFKEMLQKTDNYFTNPKELYSAIYGVLEAVKKSKDQNLLEKFLAEKNNLNKNNESSELALLAFKKIFSTNTENN